MDEQTGTVLKIEWSNGNLLDGEVATTQASATVTRCGEDVTEEYPASAFNWVRDSGDAEADATWNATHAGMKSITCTATDLNGDVKISCTLTASSASYGSITVDDDMDASHTPAELDANDVFVIENGNLKVTTSRGNVYALEDGKVKAAGAKLNGSITAETKLFASQPEDMVEFSYDHNGLRTQKKVTKADGTVETTDYVLHGKIVTHLCRGSNEMHFFYDAQSKPVKVSFNGELYSYIHNILGDVVGIIDSSGNVVLEYKYDAWGKPVVVRTLTNAYEALAELNPFRYRGYVYDGETGLYYLRSRYYAPLCNRFINADVYIGGIASITLHNIFAYCKNMPVCLADTSGTDPKAIAMQLEEYARQLAAADGPLPFGDVAAAFCLGLVITANIGMAAENFADLLSKEAEKAEKELKRAQRRLERSIALSKAQLEELKNDTTVIYRGRVYGPQSFVPSNADIYTGLSFTTDPTKFENSRGITIGELVSSGKFLCTPPNANGHVSVFPFAPGVPIEVAMSDWQQQGTLSPYTIELCALMNVPMF